MYEEITPQYVAEIERLKIELQTSRTVSREKHARYAACLVAVEKPRQYTGGHNHEDLP